MTMNCNCSSTTRVHNGDCPANEDTREAVDYALRTGDVIIIPGDSENTNILEDSAFMVADTFPNNVNLFTPAGNKSRFSYEDLFALKAYYAWKRPLASIKPKPFTGGLL